MNKEHQTVKPYLRVLLVFMMMFMAVSLSAQSVSVKGTVIDANGEPVIGATILQKGSSNGTVSDAQWSVHA